MKKPPASLQAEWNRKLAASGFVDLEGPGHQLSSRGGGPTPMVQSDTPEHRRHHLRVHDPEIAAQAREQARDALTWFRFASPEDRRVWEFYANNGLPRDCGKHLGMSFRQVRQAVIRIRTAIEERAIKEGNPGNPGKASWRKKIDQMIQALDVETEIVLAAGLPA